MAGCLAGSFSNLDFVGICIWDNPIGIYVHTAKCQCKQFSSPNLNPNHIVRTSLFKMTFD